MGKDNSCQLQVNKDTEYLTNKHFKVTTIKMPQEGTLETDEIHR